MISHKGKALVGPLGAPPNDAAKRLNQGSPRHPPTFATPKASLQWNCPQFQEISKIFNQLFPNFSRSNPSKFKVIAQKFSRALRARPAPAFNHFNFQNFQTPKKSADARPVHTMCSPMSHPPRVPRTRQGRTRAHNISTEPYTGEFFWRV